MLQALTSSQNAAATAALAAVSSQIVFGATDFFTQPSEGTSFAFDCTPSNRVQIDRGRIGMSRFAGSASRVYSLSPLSDDDTTAAGSPPPGGSGSGGGGNSGGPKSRLTANIVFDTLKSMRDRLGVYLSDECLMDALLEHGLIKKVENEDRDAMKEFYKTLDGCEEEYERVAKAIEDREHEQAELERSLNFVINRALASIFEQMDFLSKLIKKIGFLSSLINRFMERREAKRRQHKEIEDELVKMRRDRKILKAKVDRREMLGDWLDRLRCCHDKDCYVFLTVKGELLLERMEGDRKLEYLTFEDYMKLFGSATAA